LVSDRKFFLGTTAEMFLQISAYETSETASMKKLVKMRNYTTK